MRRPAAGLLALALLLAGCTAPEGPAGSGGDGGSGGNDTTGGDPPADRTPRFAHEHAAFALWVAGERVSFRHADYDLGRIGIMRTHLHVQANGGEHIVHIEDRFPGGIPDATLGEFLLSLGIDARAGYLKLDTRDGHNGTAFPDGATHQWQVWLRPANGTWAPAPAGFGHVLRNEHRILVTYAAPGDDLVAQQASVPYMDHAGRVVRTGEP